MVIEIIGSITEITVGPEIGAVTEMYRFTVDQITEEKIVVKGMVIGAKTVVDPEIEI